MFAQLVVDFGDDIELGHAVFELPAYGRIGRFRNLSRPTHEVDLFLRFDDSKRAQHLGCGYKAG